VRPVASLVDAVEQLRGRSTAAPIRARVASTATLPPLDLRDVRGQRAARLGLEVAAAGGHALLMTGPPGSGKTMLARRLPGLLPDLDRAGRIEVTRIHSAAGEPLAPGSDGLIRRPPFRAPHHVTSRVALLGGGRHPRPGEVSLAHRGVLFLDELPEFPRATLEALRQPLEEGTVTIERHAGRTRLPAAFQLVAARNPCPCGAYGDPRGRCRCSESQRRRYQARLSGPILDRIDLHVTVPLLTPDELAGGGGEPSAAVAERVQRARRRAQARQGTSNARLADAQLGRACDLTTRDRTHAARLAGDLGLSARGHARLLRVARTLADLADAERVGPDQLAAAATFRGAT
jgi:magnesium chelatase family protein